MSQSLRDIPITRDLVQRFWERVNFKGRVVYPELGRCWEWTGANRGAGYGAISVSTSNSTVTVQAHRLSCFMATRNVPDDLMVRHRCDNPSCVKPHHLLIGTAQDNSDDRLNRVRDYTGLSLLALSVLRQAGSNPPRKHRMFWAIDDYRKCESDLLGQAEILTEEAGRVAAERTYRFGI